MPGQQDLRHIALSPTQPSTSEPQQLKVLAVRDRVPQRHDPLPIPRTAGDLGAARYRRKTLGQIGHSATLGGMIRCPAKTLIAGSLPVLRLTRSSVSAERYESGRRDRANTANGLLLVRQTVTRRRGPRCSLLVASCPSSDNEVCMDHCSAGWVSRVRTQHLDASGTTDIALGARSAFGLTEKRRRSPHPVCRAEVCHSDRRASAITCGMLGTANNPRIHRQ